MLSDVLNGFVAMSNQSDVNKISNPPYVNAAPCPCDVTPGACDVNCCCDSVRFSAFIRLLCNVCIDISNSQLIQVKSSQVAFNKIVASAQLYSKVFNIM